MLSISRALRLVIYAPLSVSLTLTINSTYAFFSFQSINDRVILVTNDKNMMVKALVFDVIFT